MTRFELPRKYNEGRQSICKLSVVFFGFVEKKYINLNVRLVHKQKVGLMSTDQEHLGNNDRHCLSTEIFCC